MGKSRGIVKLRGKIGGVTFSEKDGKNIVGETSILDKDRVLKDPAFKRTRENMAEFGGAAKIGKAMRSGLASVLRSFGDSSIAGRLTGIFRKMANSGAGIRGKRPFDVVTNKHLLVGLHLDKRESFQQIFNAPYTLTVNADRNEVVWDIPDFHTDTYIGIPQGATHFRLINMVSALSNYVYNDGIQKYEALEPAVDGLNALSDSGIIQLGGDVGGVTTLTSTLPGSPVLPVDAALIACIGIEFYQEVDGAFYLLATDNAMKIADVF